MKENDSKVGVGAGIGAVIGGCVMGVGAATIVPPPLATYLTLGGAIGGACLGMNIALGNEDKRDG